MRKIWRNGREHKKIAEVIDFWANSQFDEWNFAASRSTDKMILFLKVFRRDYDSYSAVGEKISGCVRRRDVV